MSLVHKFKGSRSHFFIDSFHTLHVQRTGILNSAICRRFDDATRAKVFPKRRIHNRCLLHYAVHDHEDEPRTIHRLQVEGPIAT